MLKTIARPSITVAVKGTFNSSDSGDESNSTSSSGSDEQNEEESPVSDFLYDLSSGSQSLTHSDPLLTSVEISTSEIMGCIVKSTNLYNIYFAFLLIDLCQKILDAVHTG